MKNFSREHNPKSSHLNNQPPPSNLSRPTRPFQPPAGGVSAQQPIQRLRSYSQLEDEDEVNYDPELLPQYGNNGGHAANQAQQQQIQNNEEQQAVIDNAVNVNNNAAEVQPQEQHVPRNRSQSAGARLHNLPPNLNQQPQLQQPQVQPQGQAQNQPVAGQHAHDDDIDYSGLANLFNPQGQAQENEADYSGLGNLFELPEQEQAQNQVGGAQQAGQQPQVQVQNQAGAGQQGPQPQGPQPQVQQPQAQQNNAEYTGKDKFKDALGITKEGADDAFNLGFLPSDFDKAGQGTSEPTALDDIATTANAFSDVASLAGGIAEGYKAVTSQDDRKDTAVSTMQAVREGGNITFRSMKLAAAHAKNVGSHAAKPLAHAAIIPGIAVNAADAVIGGIQTGFAWKRKWNLKNIFKNRQRKYNPALQQDQLTNADKIARVAKSTQKTKRNLGMMKVAKGIAGVAGLGLILGGAAFAPAGLAVLGGAALVGIGAKVYDQYRKHKLLKKMQASPGKYGLNPAEVTDNALKAGAKRRSWMDYIRTERTRKMNYVKGILANRLHQMNPNDQTRHDIIKNIGLKQDASAKSIKGKL